jgi:hypothetical protein
MDVIGQLHAPATHFPRERIPGTHWIGVWVGLGAGLYAEVREKSFASAGDRTPVVQFAVRTIVTELLQLLQETVRKILV